MTRYIARPHKEIGNFRNIFEAAKGGSVDDVRCLVELQGRDCVNAKDSDGLSPLFYAAENPNVEVMKYLISKGSKVDIKKEGVGVLHFTAMLNPNVEVLKYLISHGALGVNVRCNEGRTPLHYAARSNPNVEVLKCLISSGANVDAKTNDGRTPQDVADTEEKKRVLRERGNKGLLGRLFGK